MNSSYQLIIHHQVGTTVAKKSVIRTDRRLFAQLTLFLACHPLCFAWAKPPVTPRFRHGIIVRSAANLKNLAAVKALVKQAKVHRIDTLVVGAKQDEDDEFPSGTVFFQSRIAPMANPRFDALKAVIREAHRVGIKVQAWVPQFHDQVAFYRGGKNAEGYCWAMKALIQGKVQDYTYTGKGNIPKGQSHDYFVNPCSPAVRAYQRQIIGELLQHYPVDGIVLDWIRFDHWNMDMGPDTLAAFRKAHPGIDPRQIPFDNADLDTNPRLAAWQKWRCQQIGDHVKDVFRDIQTLRKGTPLGVFTLPPSFEECGQDAATFIQYLNFISPMCYFRDWGFSSDWVCNDILKDVNSFASPSIMVHPTLDAPPKHTRAEYQAIASKMHSQFPAIKTVYYFTYGKWTIDQLRQISDIK